MRGERDKNKGMEKKRTVRVEKSESEVGSEEGEEEDMEL